MTHTIVQKKGEAPNSYMGVKAVQVCHCEKPLLISDLSKMRDYIGSSAGLRGCTCTYIYIYMCVYIYVHIYICTAQAHQTRVHGGGPYFNTWAASLQKKIRVALIDRKPCDQTPISCQRPHAVLLWRNPFLHFSFGCSASKFGTKDAKDANLEAGGEVPLGCSKKIASGARKLGH